MSFDTLRVRIQGRLEMNIRSGKMAEDDLDLVTYLRCVGRNEAYATVLNDIDLLEANEKAEGVQEPESRVQAT